MNNDLLRAARRDYNNIYEIVKMLNEYSAKKLMLNSASEWLLDNIHIIQRAYKTSSIGLPSKYIKSLSFNHENKRIYDEIYADDFIKLLMEDNLKNKESFEDDIIEFLNKIDNERYLSIGELWAFPLILSLKIICLLSDHSNDVYSLVVDKNDGRNYASKINYNSLCNIEYASISEHFKDKNNSYIYGALMYMQDNVVLNKETLYKLENIIDVNLNDVISDELDRESYEERSISKLITILRYLGDIDWRDVFCNVSRVEKILSNDDIYNNMDFESKDYYRRSIEKLSRKYEKEEFIIAEEALKLSRLGKQIDDREYKGHVGYYIIDDGLKMLKRDLAIKNKKFTKKNKVSVFVISNLLLTLFISSIITLIGGMDSIIQFLLILIPCSEISNAIIIFASSKLKRPRFVPKMNLEDSIGNENRTVVVIPVIVNDYNKLKNYIDNIECFYLSNNDENIYFALLCDYGDSSYENEDNDINIRQYGVELVKKLNEKYSFRDDKFFFFCRKRKYNSNDGIFMGYERKRGKLLEFMQLLRGSEDTSFDVMSGDISSLKSAKYMITLDADTIIPMGAAAKLIGAISHPLNRAYISNNAVYRGYGIMQPRISVKIEDINRTYFSKIFSGDGGLDIYTTAASDIYEDLFGEGSFTGKGIIDIDTYLSLLSNVIPENLVLSHDLLEGIYTRCALVTDTEFVDSYPSTYESSCKRLERWVRGDYQIISWLLSEDVSLLNKWKIFDNIRRSLISPSIMIGIFLNLIFWRNTLYWTSAFILQIFFILVFTMTDFVVTPMKSKRIKYRSFPQVLLSLSFLPNQSVLMIKSITKSIYRMTISKKKLLEWKTSESTEEEKSNKLLEYVKLQFPAMIISLLYIIINFFKGYEFGLMYLPLGLLWLFSPVLSYLISFPRNTGEMKINSNDIKILKLISRKTWKYYDEFVNEENNYLPPDNYQEQPFNGEAHRTSPTNMGLSLMSDVCAYDMGYIDTYDLIDRLYKSLNSISKLERLDGNLYNWYDTRTMRPLYPKYVSTVDCGNFIGYIMIIKEAINEAIYKNLYKHKESDISFNEIYEEYNKSIKIIDDLIKESNFKALYDEKRELFHIGINGENGEKSLGYYDFLASECRLASFVAIIKGDVSYKHWFRLSRAKGNAFGIKVLTSWSGTMFEYLMPSLVMEDYEDTLLHNTYKKVVEAQIKYGEKSSIPWGISEAAYYHFDAAHNYQYKAFGVPNLGLKRGLEQELVVSPYSTIISVQFDYKNAINNIKRLINLGALGRYGFYDSIDYTKDRIKQDDNYLMVKTYMVHHNGMIMVALDNILNDNIMKKRFHNIPRVKAYELLLKEKDIQLYIYNRDNVEMNFISHDIDEELILRNVNNLKAVNLMSNKDYSMIITGGGSGLSYSKEMCINRWREDSSLEKGGIYLYIKNINNNEYWSVSYEPTEKKGDKSSAYFMEEKAIFEKTVGSIETREEVIICDNDKGEIRRVTISNNGDKTRIIEATSYMEVTLSSYKEDYLHPAFSNLFISTDYDEESKCLIASRRQRTKSQKKKFEAMHITVEGKIIGDIQYETDRERFIGRNRNLKDPLAMEDDSELHNSIGTVLDPIMAMRVRIEIKPYEKADVSFIYMNSDSRENAIDMCLKYRLESSINKAISNRERSSKEFLYNQGIKSSIASLYSSVLSNVIFLPNKRDYKNKYLESYNDNIRKLWSFGISGDLPIVLFIVDEERISTLRNVILMHRYWSEKNFNVDLVIYDDEESDYDMKIKNKAVDIINSSPSKDKWNVKGGIFLITNSDDNYNVKALLIMLSRLVIDDDSIFKEKSNGGLIKPLGDYSNLKTCNKYCKCNYDIDKLDFYNGYGGFRKDNGHYVIVLRNGNNTPAPWSNVLSNKKFGSVVTESGGGYTYAFNSREYKISPWSNDWIKDNCDERLYIRINNTNEVFSIMKKPIDDNGEYVIEHGFGYTDFTHRYNDIEGRVRVFVPNKDNMKILKISLKNYGDNNISLSILYYMQLVLGTAYEETCNYIYTKIINNKCIYGRNISSPFWNNVYSYMMICGGTNTSFLGDRREFFGLRGEYDIPAALSHKVLSNIDGFNDPCLCCMSDIEINSNEEKDIYIIIGAENSEDDVMEKVESINPVMINNKFIEMYDYYEKFLNKIHVDTPDKSINYLMNGYLMYQTLACRFNARSAFYQSGGAIGYRDQLQDSLSLCLFDERMTRNHILLCASRQYEEGDVQHWFHTIINSGIRTRFSDDLLWLPFVTSKYIIRTGDYEILNENVTYIKDEELSSGEDERYTESYVPTVEKSIYDHCIRAIKRSLKFGEHGIPLMGSGDWNDGMNTVGNKGKGESIWLGWFLIDILGDFIIISKVRNDEENNELFVRMKEKIIKAVEENGWDGSWYRRAYFDDGTPLGSVQNKECMIDSLSQSWSVISNSAKKERALEAMNALNKNLVESDIGIIRLLSPSFRDSCLEPGYIKGYIDGVRENGGQYTHAAVWAILAETKLNHGNTAMEYFSMINPINHSMSKVSANTYRVEPYVICADVYNNTYHRGRGGWSWYTGASGWYYKVGLENILGYKKKFGNSFIIKPCIPDDWKKFSITINEEGCVYNINVIRGDSPSILVDGIPYEDELIRFEKGSHDVIVTI